MTQPTAITAAETGLGLTTRMSLWEFLPLRSRSESLTAAEILKPKPHELADWVSDHSWGDVWRWDDGLMGLHFQEHDAQPVASRTLSMSNVHERLAAYQALANRKPRP